MPTKDRNIHFFYSTFREFGLHWVLEFGFGLVDDNEAVELFCAPTLTLSAMRVIPDVKNMF